MLYDLSIAWTPSTTAAEIVDTLAMSAELGYDVVALDHVYTGPVPAAITNPIPQPLLPAAEGPARRRLPRVLRRATVVVSDMTVNHRLAAVAAAYDVVAVRPTTEKAFQAACLNMTEPALISLDLTTYFPFFFKHRAAMAAVRRGVHFEVCYAQVLRAGDKAGSGSANRARALFIANLAGLIRATRGRGIVVSSGALMGGRGGGGGGGGALELRGPADVVNLLAVWGLPPDRGTEALSALPRSVVANEGLRRRGFRGIVDIVQTAENSSAGQGQQKKPDDSKKDKQKGQQKQGQDNGGMAGQKRRASANGNGNGNGNGETAENAQQKQTQNNGKPTQTAGNGLNERQAKKQKRGIGR